MKTINGALELRGRIFGAFEMAESEDDPGARRAWLTFVVVGGGPAGVEIAGQIAELARHALKGNFRQINPDDAKVVLFDGGKEILANFGDRLSGKAAGELERLGVEIHCGSIVIGMDAFGVRVKGHDGAVQRIPSRTKVWLPGCRRHPSRPCWRTDPARAPTRQAGSRCCLTARCLVTRRCSPLAT